MNLGGGVHINAVRTGVGEPLQKRKNVSPDSRVDYKTPSKSPRNDKRYAHGWFKTTILFFSYL